MLRTRTEGDGRTRGCRALRCWRTIWWGIHIGLSWWIFRYAILLPTLFILLLVRKGPGDTNNMEITACESRCHLGPGDLRYIRIQPRPRLLPHVRTGELPGGPVVRRREGGKDVHEEGQRQGEERAQEHKEQAVRGGRCERACVFESWGRRWRRWEDEFPGRIVWTLEAAESGEPGHAAHAYASCVTCCASTCRGVDKHHGLEQGVAYSEHRSGAAEGAEGNGDWRRSASGQCRFHSGVDSGAEERGAKGSSSEG